jgi:amidophosphoribosyltransferase
LIAHEKTRQDIAKHINADDVIYQDLDALKAACADASPNSEIKDFEVGVFCGTYKTEVPEGYFEHLNESRGKKRKMAGAGEVNSALVGNSGPVSVSQPEGGLNLDLRTTEESVIANGPRSPQNREDIRYAHS